MGLRRRSFVVTTWLVLASPASHAAITGEALDAAAKSLEPRVIEWRRDFHQHPELSNREVRTSQKVADHLKSLGLEVRTGVAHTGVVGILRGGKPGPTIALRADMDALPVTEQVDLPFKSMATSEYRGEKVGVMHACGHDGHTAVLMATAQVLASMRKELPGTVVFIFQPAEEGAPDGEEGGAPLMLKEGVLDAPKPEAIFGMHLLSYLYTGQVGYRPGPAMAASDRFRILVTGRQTHGARPWKGVDPIVVAAQIVMGLQTIVGRQVDISNAPAVVTVGAINGGIRNNIIPDTVEMIGTFRTFDVAVRQQIIDSMTRIAKDIASSAGATADVEIADDNNPVLVNDPQLTERMLPSLRRVVGPENVLLRPYFTGAEDYAFFADRLPSMYFWVGVTPRDRPMDQVAENHSPKFYIDEPALQIAVRAMLGVTVDYLQAGAR